MSLLLFVAFIITVVISNNIVTGLFWLVAENELEPPTFFLLSVIVKHYTTTVILTNISHNIIILKCFFLNFNSSKHADTNLQCGISPELKA